MLGINLTAKWNPPSFKTTKKIIEMKKLLQLSIMICLSLLMSEQSWGQYTGSGTFEKITSLGDLTDGYYVILESNEDFAMNNTHNGTFLATTSVNPSSDELNNPSGDIVWLIETNGSGRSIYNENSEKYVSYTGSSNNVQVLNAISTNNQIWNITYSSNQFVFNNVAVPSRILQYNPGAPRFACYTSNQGKFSLYKLTSVAINPEPTNQPTEFVCTGVNSLTWTDATGSQVPDGYLIKWSDISYADISNPTDGSTSNGVNSTTINQGVESATITGLDPNTTYYYKIWPYTNSGSDIDYKTNGTIQQTDCTTPAGPCFEESFDGVTSATGGSSGSYTNKTWTGDDGFTWTATDARTDQSINGPGIMVRNGSLSANNITGGISSLTLTTQRQFSGGSGNLTVYVNGTSVGTIPYSGSVQTNTISNINVSGTYDLEIETSNSDRIVMDDLEIICFTPTTPEVGFDSASSTVNETNATFTINIPVTLCNFSSNVDLSVSVDGSSTAEASDYTLNTNTLSFTGNGTQNISLDINPDAGYDDETIILEIAETTSTGVTITTSQHTVTVLDDETAPLGWQITVEDTDFVIDFDNSVAGVNNGPFDGSGFSPSPITGQLNSQAWETTGMSDGNSNFGDTETSGDFARGSSTGGVGTGGFYAFETSSNDFSLGFQGGGIDFTPGTITLRAQNQTGDSVNNANLSYILYVFNDQDRANSFNFSYSTDGSNYTTIPSLDFTSAEVADGSPVWVSNAKAEFISGLSIADGVHLYLRWESNDVSGSGSRDELAIDDITLNFNPSSPLPVELISFDATVVDEQKSVVLEWETASESNNDYFTIERSVDGYNWESITSVNGMGNSSVTTRYAYKDRQPMKGVSYYRLKQTDFNGDSEFFDIRSVMINADDKALLFRVNMLGQKVDTSYKGLVFLHFSDGSTVQILQNN